MKETLSFGPAKAQLRQYFRNNFCKQSTLSNQFSIEQIKEFLIKEYELLIEGHTSSVKGAAITIDSKFIVSCSSDRMKIYFLFPNNFFHNLYIIILNYQSQLTIAKQC